MSLLAAEIDRLIRHGKESLEVLTPEEMNDLLLRAVSETPERDRADLLLHDSFDMPLMLVSDLVLKKPERFAETARSLLIYQLAPRLKEAYAEQLAEHRAERPVYSENDHLVSPP